MTRLNTNLCKVFVCRTVIHNRERFESNKLTTTWCSHGWVQVQVQIQVQVQVQVQVQDQVQVQIYRCVLHEDGNVLLPTSGKYQPLHIIINCFVFPLIFFPLFKKFSHMN